MRMFAFLFISGLVASSLAAPQQQPSYNYNPYLSLPTTTPAPIIHPPAQVHYVNIGQELNGDYKFGYDTGKGPSGQSFREETRLPDGTVKGQYGYLDAQNRMRIVKYTAGLNGFQIDSDTALNDQQLAASRPSQPVQQQQPTSSGSNAAAPSSYYQPQSLPKPPAYQGLASAASSQPASIAQYVHPSAYQSGAYAPQPAAPTAPIAPSSYSGYPNAASNPSQYAAPSYTANPSAAYQPNQLTPSQLQQQAVLAARARQAALARQQQQEALIRQQQQAATEAILAQQRAAAAAHAASQQQIAPQQQYQPQYSSQPASPSYAPSNAFNSPVTANSAAAATAPAQAPVSAAPSYAPRNSATELKPDLLSNFIQLPGVKLIQLDKKPVARSASPSYSPSLSSNSFGLATSGPSANPAKPEDDYQGPVVINAALLSYNIGANQQAQAAANAQNKKA